MAIVAYAGTDTRGLVGGLASSSNSDVLTPLSMNVSVLTVGPVQP